jgi:hypothetical protein
LQKHYIKHDYTKVPFIAGAKGGKGSFIAPNSLFSSDILFMLIGLGEGPIYRVNPNGSQDIQIQDSSIDDLVNLYGDGGPNTDLFYYIATAGTTTQGPLPYFGDEIVSPQGFASAVSLKKGNTDGVPENKVVLQETSAEAWDSLRFNFVVDSLLRGTEDGDVYEYSIQIAIDLFDNLANPIPVNGTSNRTIKEISGKTDSAFKTSTSIAIPEEYKSVNGYRFSVSKISDDPTDSRISDEIRFYGWDEIRNEKLAYPRTALLGLALKAVNEHQGAIPNFTSLVKGLLVKVPSNYNQPILSNGEIDWREVEIPDTGDNSLTSTGYRLQSSGSTVLYDAQPEIYKGVWDGSFTYSWTQNPVWVIYDILTNKTYGLSIPEQNIDKYKFYKVAMYADACDFTTGKFIGVDGLADGSFRSKPRGTFTSILENQLGLPTGTPIKERRFICDISISSQKKAIDILNDIAASIRSVIIYSGGKITLATDMPDEYPSMIFNEANIKKGSLSISGYKLSEVLTGVDVAYIDPTNHFIREVVNINANEVNRGDSLSEVDNVLNIDLAGVTRRSQAMRAGQYFLAASRYQKRAISFTTSTQALYLSPGDLISVATRGSSINYGFGGRIYANSAIDVANNTNVFLEHFTVPAITESNITANTYPLALRITKQDTDRTDLYIISNNIFETNSVYSAGIDTVTLKLVQKYDPITKTFGPVLSSLDANVAPAVGDLWSFGEILDPLNFYTSKAGRLFKVTEIRRSEDEETNISAVEYIPQVYKDSDSFIDYDPVPYADFINYFAPPTIPKVSITVTPKTKLDGSVTADAKIYTSTDYTGNQVKFTTEYFLSKPIANALLSNAWGNEPVYVKFDGIDNLSNGFITHLQGKNGFTTRAGAIRLLCNSYSITDITKIALSVEGLSVCEDLNFAKHVLEVNDGTTLGALKGTDAIVIPINALDSDAGLLNFVGYASRERQISREILEYDLSNNIIVIDDTVSGTSKLFDIMPPAPFYVTISQVLDAQFYSNNSFYIDGYSTTKILEGDVDAETVIELPIKPRTTNSIRLYIDGILKNTGQYIVNRNINSSIAANIVYAAVPNDVTYRVEVDYYLPPPIEVGDTLQLTGSNLYTVTNSSYDTTSNAFSSVLTSNSIFRIGIDTVPTYIATGSEFINVTPNPEGIIANIENGVGTFDYNTNTYTGSLNLANNGVYSINIQPNSFEQFTLDNDSLIKDLPLGITTIRVRNKNLYGRTSRYVEKTITVDAIPIQRVENIQIKESLYREQTGGVAVRATIEFDHIQGQEVTDYELSYKISNVEDELGKNTTGITAFNTVKLPVSGNDNGIMRFTINNIDRGTTAGANTLTVKITPLNRNIRGKTTTVEQIILGKTVAPDNIFNFTGGQQNEIITLFWSYPRIGDQLKDLDLKEIVIRRIEGVQAATLDNFAAARPFVTVSVGSSRKSIPIDTYGTFTYLARTRDTSDILSDGVVGVVLTTTKPQRSTIIAAYSEDNPSVPFSGFINNNSTETFYPSFNDSNSGGIAYSYTSATDNANGSSSGWSLVAGENTDILADDYAEYITQIRDLEAVVTASISIDITANQTIETSFNDQKTVFISGTSEVSDNASILTEVDFGGIGHLLGSANASVPSPRFDANNRTWMTGGAAGNVWAIWNPGQFIGDTANANSYALIAGLINTSAIRLGASFHANGDPTGGNALANLTQVASNYQLVNLTQYSDLGSLTYQGDLGAVFSQTFIRTSSSESLFYANGNVNIQEFDNYIVDDGWTPYEAGSRTFRYLQIKYRVFNNDPKSYDLTLDNFRYTINKEQTITSNTITYSTSPTTVDFTSQGYLRRPVVSYAVLDQIDAEANPVIAVSTAVSNTSLSFKLFASNGTGEYNANSTANVMITIVGV